MSIDLNKITLCQKLTITKGLCDYQYIMDNWRINDADFQKVYYEFYLRSRWAVINKGNNKEKYFKVLQQISPETSMIDVVKILFNDMENHSYEFSLASKLLHTRDDSLPIYDSKIRKYLSKEENVNFWWQIPNKVSNAPSGKSELEKIDNDWKLLCDWYDKFLPSQLGSQWIGWFDNNFPTFEHISDVKKVDFIIFATN